MRVLTVTVVIGMSVVFAAHADDKASVHCWSWSDRTHHYELSQTCEFIGTVWQADAESVNINEDKRWQQRQKRLSSTPAWRQPKLTLQQQIDDLQQRIETLE